MTEAVEFDKAKGHGRVRRNKANDSELREHGRHCRRTTVGSAR